MIFTEKYIKMNKKVKDSFLREKKEQIQQLENRVGEKEILYMYTFFWPFLTNRRYWARKFNSSAMQRSPELIFLIPSRFWNPDFCRTYPIIPNKRG